MQRIREKTAAAKRANADFFFPEIAIWSDGVERAFKVSDPNRAGASTPLQLVNDPLPASLRVLKVHPDQSLPQLGASVACSEGFLVLGVWTDEGKMSGARVGVCRLVDARAYPLEATTASGAQLRLRIEALDAPALSVDKGSLTGASDNSHLGHLPPGVQLQPGEVITTADGDRYLVVPPVQRDSLGDTVGLSWQGSPATRPRDPLPPPGSSDPTPETPGTPARDPWWDEGLP